jgi:uncharacterized protein (TIGR02266 family)
MFVIASEKTYADGEIVFKEGSSGDWIYIVLSGSVEISKTVGEKKVIFGVLKPEDVFGELSFFSGIKRTTTAKAMGDTTLGIIDRDSLDHEFNRLPHHFRAIIRNMALRYEDLINKFSEFSPPTEEKIPKRLSLTFRDAQAFKRAYADELSKGGLFIKTKKPLKKGEKFILSLKLFELNDPIQIQSEVEWTRIHSKDPIKQPPGMRIKFCETDENIDHIFIDYIQNNL